MLAAVVLAAGGASRFGGPKMIAIAAGKPVVRWTVERALASRVERVLVVVGEEGGAVREALAGLPVRFVESPCWRDGLSASLRAGIAALGAEASGAVILLGDQPTVTPRIVDALIAAHEARGRAVVAPAYLGERGNPVLFAAAIFPELLATTGDRGARDVIARDARRVELVEIGVPAPRDVDTAEDLAAVARALGGVANEEGGRG